LSSNVKECKPLDAGLVQSLGAAAAAAPRNTFQATVLANRLANAKFALNNKEKMDPRQSSVGRCRLALSNLC